MAELTNEDRAMLAELEADLEAEAEDFANNATEYDYNNNYQPNQNNSSTKEKTILDYIEEGNVEKVKEYLDTNTNTNTNTNTKDPLVAAAVNAAIHGSAPQSQYQEILKKILAAGYKPNDFPSKTKRLPLNYAARAKSEIALPLMKLLIEYGAYIGKSSEGAAVTIPPIFDAIEGGSDAIKNLDFLVENKANIDIKNPYEYNKESPLSVALHLNNADAAEYLLNKDAKISKINLFGDNMFISALKMKKSPKKYTVIKLFLNRNELETGFETFNKKNAIFIAIDQRDPELLDLLLSNKQFAKLLNKGIQTFGTPLNYTLNKSSLREHAKNNSTAIATEIEYDALLPYLIRKGAKLSSVDESPFTHLIQNENKRGVDLAIDLGFKLNNLDMTTGFTPLIYAAYLGKSEMIQYLRERGADPTILTGDKRSIIEVAIHANQIAIAKQFLKEFPPTEDAGTDFILDAAMFVTSEVDLLDIFHTLIDEMGYNPSAVSNQTFMTPLMGASSEGNLVALQYLLDKKVDVTVETGPHKQTAYDLAKNMEVRFILAPFYEVDQPRFKGFTKDNFEAFDVVFDDDKNFVICPCCFLIIQHGGGCMYIFEHNCPKQHAMLKSLGTKSLPPVHDKLYNTYKDEKGFLTICYHCNRLGSTWTLNQYGPDEADRFVGHQHIQLNRANPFVKINAAPGKNRDPHNKETCVHVGGGGPREKFIRFQLLMNFMCKMNESMIGKVSNNMAHLMAREAFWDAALDEEEYKKAHPNESLLDPASGLSADAIIADIKQKKHFIVNCEFSTEEENAVANRVYPNVPRYGSNDTTLAPILAGRDDGETPGLQCFYQTDILWEDSHNDGRELWGFRHRQPVSKNVYDHNARKEYICAPCLESFLNNTFTSSGSFECFNSGECKGHFHPNELQGKISEELYQNYKKVYNESPPQLGGDRQDAYPPVLGPVVKIKQNYCLLGGKGKQRRTRKVSMRMKKTRKARRYTKTRKH